MLTSSSANLMINQHQLIFNDQLIFHNQPTNQPIYNHQPTNMEPINQRCPRLRLLGIEAASEALAKGIAAGRQKGRGLAFLRPFKADGSHTKGLVNIPKTRENHHFQWVNPLSMTKSYGKSPFSSLIFP